MSRSKNIKHQSYSFAQNGSDNEIHELTFEHVDPEPKQIDEISFEEVSSLPPFHEIAQGDLFSLKLSNDTTELTHGMHRFPAKFVPQVPRWALQEFAPENGCVVDPFMGSGTTLVEGLLRKGLVLGYDIDPLSRLIAQAKTTSPDLSRVATLSRVIRNQWHYPATSLIPPLPDIKNFEHWFSNEAWGMLQSLLAHIQQLDCNEEERRFFLVVFSSILRRVSNADDQSQKTYVSGTLLKTPPPVQEVFWKSLEKALTGLRQLEQRRHPHGRVVVKTSGNAHDLELDTGSVDLFITSPPYLDSVDYMYNFMVEYFWLGSLLGIHDRKTYNMMKRKFLGAKRPELLSSNSMPSVLSNLIDIDNLPLERRKATVAYFDGMAQHFSEAARCLRPGGRYVLVIGNSQTRNGAVPVHDCLIRLAAAEGLEMEKALAYRVRRHYMKFPRNGRGGIILIDWIIVFRNTGIVTVSPNRLPLLWTVLGHNSVAH